MIGRLRYTFFNRSVTSGELILAVAMFIAVSANTAFFSAAIAAFGNGATAWPFHASLFLSVVAFFVLLLSLLCHRMLVKPVLILFVMASAGFAYFAHAYGTVFDRQMIANALQTDSAEAFDLVTPALLIWVAVFGVLPSIAVWRSNLVFPDWKAETIARLKLAGVALAVLAVSGLAFGGHYAGLLRQHPEVTGRLIPSYPLVSAFRHFMHGSRAAHDVHVVIGQDAVRTAHPQRELVIMVVGETVRADHWGLNGYVRDTTPSLRKEKVLNFAKFGACGTSTAVAVPCMFSDLGRANFDTEAAVHRDNVLDVLARTGVSVLWRDNNSSSKGVADRVTYEDFKSPARNPICEDGECRDEGMLAGLQDYIDKQTGDILIVLHQMGNHGPAYYKRYPKEFERFTPVCATSDLGSCTSEQLINTYDNAILYTDHFLSKVILLLKANDANFETAMFYLSDHGESLGEFGLYLHGAPYALAPEAQKHVPAVMWLGEGMKRDVVQSSLAERSQRQWSQDNVFSTLLGFFEINSHNYDPKQDILERTGFNVSARH
ncbi:MAG: phosphoethanolamine--lipid A transferase [Hyphomicrobium sp.]|nr:phosphoethanolamine--lipid A transferase [Hyphomicrobium sp.]